MRGYVETLDFCLTRGHLKSRLGQGDLNGRIGGNLGMLLDQLD